MIGGMVAGLYPRVGQAVWMLGIEHSLAFKHDAGEGEPTIGGGTEGAGVAMVFASQRGVPGSGRPPCREGKALL
jgi:hypothetical protein